MTPYDSIRMIHNKFRYQQSISSLSAVYLGNRRELPAAARRKTQTQTRKVEVPKVI